MTESRQLLYTYGCQIKKWPRGCSEHPETRPTEREQTVDKKSLAHTAHPVRVDHALLEEISELTGIEYQALSSAFAGEEKNLALDVVKTIVAENLDATPETWAERFTERAKAEGLGEYRPGYWNGYELTYEYNDYVRSIGRL